MLGKLLYSAHETSGRGLDVTRKDRKPTWKDRFGRTGALKHPATTRLNDGHGLLEGLLNLAATAVERLRTPAPVSETSISIDIDGMVGLDLRHGEGAASHAAMLMARALEEETGPNDFIARTGLTTFAVVLSGADRAGAEAFVERAQSRFEALVFDAGYECDVQLEETSIPEAEEVSLLDRPTPVAPVVPPVGAVFLN